MAVRRISIGPGDAAGYFARLKTGFDELDIPCEHFLLASNKYAYQEAAYFLKNTYSKVVDLQTSRFKVIRIFGRLLSIGIRLLVFIYALFRCDVFIFTGFTSFFRFRELRLLKWLGKRVLVVYVGSDARPPIFSGRHLDDEGGLSDPCSLHAEVLHLFKQIRRIEQHADVIVNHTAITQFFTRPFVRVNAVGTPFEIREKTSPPIVRHSNVIRILHAPSRPLAKGSLIFRQLIDELRAEGHAIEFVELVGVPNSTVLEELQKCDFVLDELYSDAPMAMLATEAAMYGKPVVVGGFYAEQYKIDNPDPEMPPTLFVEPEDIKQAIRKMIVDQGFRLDLGRRAHDFILERWNPRRVAQNYLRLINGDIPENWISNPESMVYCWGWGLSKENWRKQVGEYVAELGEDALLFNHNPKLKQRVLDEISQVKVAHTL